MKKLSTEKLAQYIELRRKEKKISQAQLAEQTGINRVMISKIEHQEYIPSVIQLQALGEVLGFEVTDLFTDDKKTSSKERLDRKYNIAVAGTGYVGLSIATLLAQHNHVTAVDIIPEKVEMINNRKSPIQDDYIEKYLAEKDLDLTATLDGASAYRDADFVIIAAPTNYDSKKNFFDCSAVEAVIELVKKENPQATMVIKSTIPVGYTESVRKKFDTKNIIFSPEFLRESKALYDNLYPSRIIVSCDETTEDKLYDILSKLDGVYGARFSGAGFKGCCMALIDPNKADEIRAVVEREYLKEFPSLAGKYKAYICSTADGVGKAEGDRF